MTLKTAFRLGAAGDDVYAALLEAHERLAPAESAALNARLVLILMNHIGDPDVLIEALDKARSRPPS